MTDSVTLEFIGRSMQDIDIEIRAIRAEHKETRGELRDVRTIVLSSIDQVRRVRDDLELMIRSETMGRATHLETVLEREMGELRDRIGALEHTGV